MKPGKSIYGVARQHGVTLAELQRVNGITEPTRVRAGTVLSVPGKAEAAAPVAETASVPLAPAPRSSQVAPVQPRMLNAPSGERTAALGDRSTDATTAPAAALLLGGCVGPVPLAGPGSRHRLLRQAHRRHPQ